MTPANTSPTPGTTHTCKNCGHTYTGKFCNLCGQRADTRRLNAAAIIHDLVHAVTHVDKGFWHSIKAMFLSPGHTIRDYLEGKRVGHSNPILMLLIIGTLGSFLYDKYQVASLNSVKLNEIHVSIHAVTSKFFFLVTFAYSFLFAGIDKLFFRYKEYYYTELLVANIFQMITVMIANILLLPVWIALGDSRAGDIGRIVVYLGIVAYFIHVRYQFFEAGRDKRSRNRLIMEAVLFFLLMFLIGGNTIRHLLQPV